MVSTLEVDQHDTSRMDTTSAIVHVSEWTDWPDWSDTSEIACIQTIHRRGDDFPAQLVTWEVGFV